MKNMYEAMIIFPKALEEDALEKAINNVKTELEKAGGEVDSVTRLGRRSFARMMHKQDAGHYAVIEFAIEGSEIGPLQKRFKLNDDVLRVQIVCANESDKAEEAEKEEAVAEEKA